MRRPPTILRSTETDLSPPTVITLYVFSNMPRTRSDVAVPALTISRSPKFHTHGLCLWPHRTRSTPVASMVRSTSPASVMVRRSAPVSGMPIRWWCMASIFTRPAYLFMVRSSHRFCLYPTSPSLRSGLEVPTVTTTTSSPSSLTGSPGKYFLKCRYPVFL